jgi:integrase
MDVGRVAERLLRHGCPLSELAQAGSDLRHTFGTRMAAAGIPIRAVQEWMGHRDISTTQRYADYAPRYDEREMVQRPVAAAAATRPVPAAA